MIGQTVSSVPDIADHVIVVDDASTDATAEKARVAGDERLEVICTNETSGSAADPHRPRPGHPARRGRLRGHGRGRADGSGPPSGLLDPIAEDGYDFAKANRFFDFGSYEGMPRTRAVGNVAVGFMAKASTGYWHLFDPLNGYTAVGPIV